MSHRIFHSRGLSAALVEHFADGAWYTLDKAASVVHDRIPLQIAIRAYRRTYVDPRQSPAPARTDEEKIRLGTRLLVTVALHRLGAEPSKRTGRGRWERFRLPPGAYGQLRGERAPQAKLTAEIVLHARERYAAGGVSMAGLAAELGHPIGAVRQAIRGKSWAHLPGAVSIEQRSQRVLSPDQVRALRRRFARERVTMQALAAEYGVSASTIGCVIRGRNGYAEPSASSPSSTRRRRNGRLRVVDGEDRESRTSAPVPDASAPNADGAAVTSD